MTSDVWFTLVYLRPRDQRALERARRKVWAAPLVRSGLSRSRSERAAAEVESWAARQESRGWTPTIADQSERLSGATGVRFSSAEVGRELDAAVATSSVRVAPGALQALERLRSDGVRLGIVSNVLHETPNGLRELLNELGLLSYFSAVVLSSEHRWSKPRAEPFRMALARLRSAPETAGHLGDLLYDVLGARRAGVRPLLYTGLHRFEPSRLIRLATRIDPTVERIERWRDLPEVLRRPAPPGAVRSSDGRPTKTRARSSSGPGERSPARPPRTV